MRQKYFFAAAMAVLAFLLNHHDLHAQSPDTDQHQIELGAQFSVLHNRSTEVTARDVICVRAPCPPVPELIQSSEVEPGVGLRIGYNLTNNFAIEAEGNFFPRDRLFAGGRKAQGLFGVKAGRRFDKVGVFGKARPGFLYARQGDLRLRTDSACVAVFPPPVGCFESRSQTSFAFDIGGVIELYPTPRTIVRFDAGDTIVRFGERNIAAPSTSFPGGVVVRVPADTTHNFQGSVGIGFRF